MDAVVQSSFYLSCVAVCGQWVSALLGLLTVVEQQPHGSKINIFIESVSIPAKSLPIVFWILLSIGGVVIGLYLAKDRRPRAIFMGIICTLLICFYATCVGLFGFVFVFLGNVIGSPWGVYFIKNVFGQVTTGFTGLVGVIELGMVAVFGWLL